MRHTGEVITFVPWQSFAAWQGTRWQRRPEGYESFKQRLSDALLDQYLEHFPRLAGHVDHAELSTPLSTSHFARSAEGSIYGLGTPPERFADRGLYPRTRVKGLFLGGVDASTPGIVGGLSGGVMAAVAAEPRRGTRFARSLMRR
ncbi:MAG: FAD-dependent oxidoreductase, partial [Actinobacteria bacterium]|nr:FAD-dependent oxidoreductase [Actinomycetota bacterium]NIX24308.1 FAD-dependent oxidoreductase [Actinomycetota bacterium]